MHPCSCLPNIKRFIFKSNHVYLGLWRMLTTDSMNFGLRFAGKDFAGKDFAGKD